VSAPRVLLTAAEVAEVIGVSRRRVSQLVGERSDFPRPYAIAGPGQQVRLWRPEDVERWAATADRTPGRPKADPVS
jgi:predicted DNA-binding transcriptional regulator AlpA